MVFKTKKKVKVGQREIERISNITAPDAATMFPSVTEPKALALIDRAIKAHARTCAGNDLLKITAGLNEADSSQFEAIRVTLGNLEKIVSDAGQLEFMRRAVLDNPNNAKFIGLLDGSSIPTSVSYELTAEAILDLVSKPDEEEKAAE